MRRESSQRASAQPVARVSQAVHAGCCARRLLSVSRPKREVQILLIATVSDSRYPHQVSSVALSASAKPVSTKKTISSDTRATGFHFTQAEIASTTSETDRIQAQLPANRAKAIRRLPAIHPAPSR